MHLDPSQLAEIEDTIRECFESDPDLLEHWHISAPASLDECVERTMQDVVSDFDHETFSFYKAIVNSEVAGYWGTEFGNYINLIFVKPEFRNKEFMGAFWKGVQSTLKSPFFTVVYGKNTPAVDFYTARNGKRSNLEHDGQPVVAFEFQKETLCH